MRNSVSAKTVVQITPRLAQKALFLALALIAGIVERWIPFEFVVPGVKLGLANVVILTAMYLFPRHVALEISLIKCVVIGILAGTGVSFFYSVGGAVCSFIVMSVMLQLGKGKISPIGVSTMGAVFHNIGQILVASVIMRTFMVAAYLPALLVSGVITGVIVGVIVKMLVEQLPKVLQSAKK